MDTLDVMREAEIRALELIGRPLPDALQHLVNVAARVTGTAEARINVITGSAQYTLFSSRGEQSVCGLQDSFCAHIVRSTEQTHLIPDAAADERFVNSCFTTSGAIHTYAAAQLRTSSGTPIGTICVFDPEERRIDEQLMDVLLELSEATIDVLETRQRQQELRESVVQLADGQRELRRSNEHLAAFAGQVSHDIQGPLAAVLMALELLQDEGVGEQEPQGMFLRSATSGALRMRSTIAGLMDFAVIGGSLHPMRLDLHQTVHEVLDDLAARRDRSEVVVGDLPKVWGDDVQVRAVVQNLVANALKYAGHVEHPVIRIAGSVRGDMARITVSDNGPGVPEDQRESIFELMVRGEGAEGSGVEGLGIGLATCRRIVHAHRGRLGVEDSPEGGAQFWFELPLTALEDRAPVA